MMYYVDYSMLTSVIPFHIICLYAAVGISGSCSLTLLHSATLNKIYLHSTNTVTKTQKYNVYYKHTETCILLVIIQ